MLSVDGLSVRYRDLTAVCNVSFSVEKGEIVAIVGSNGAGKSSILNTVSGILRASSGVIEFQGVRVENFPAHEIVARGLAQVPEGRLLFPDLTVLENLQLAGSTQRARAWMADSLKQVYAFFPILADRKHQLAKTLSGGEQQMLAIGRSLMLRPDLLMLDEPSWGLAPKLVQSVFAALRKISLEGITILLVEQNVYQCLELANRAYVLENGRVTIEGRGSELLNNEYIKKAYLGL